MSAETIRIATRRSPLAMWQAEHVAHALTRYYPHLQAELLGMSTGGDKLLDSRLATVGGKGLFVKELELGLQNGSADIAVHSMKDVPMELPEDLHVPVVLEREDPRDVLVSNRFQALAELPAQAKIGTSSLRRQCQLRALFSQLQVIDLRGNVHTRLAKLDADEFDAIVLASAGLIRLGLDRRITNYLSPEHSLPAIGQGAIGIECRRDDPRVQRLIQPLNHASTQLQVSAERALNRGLNGGCQVPIAGYAQISGNQLHLRGLVGTPNGATVLRSEAYGPLDRPDHLGEQVATDLLHQGAEDILAELRA